eukprot:scaffold3377_cov105-Isochrysis_galbana.AAC.12
MAATRQTQACRRPALALCLMTGRYCSRARPGSVDLAHPPVVVRFRRRHLSPGWLAGNGALPSNRILRTVALDSVEEGCGKGLGEFVDPQLRPAIPNQGLAWERGSRLRGERPSDAAAAVVSCATGTGAGGRARGGDDCGARPVRWAPSAPYAAMLRRVGQRTRAEPSQCI